MRQPVLLLLICSLASWLPAQTPGPFPDWVSVESNISYDKYPQTVLDIFQPKTGAKGKRPGVIVIHGGGWTGRAKIKIFERMCLPYLERGFVVANIEYRLAETAPAPAAVSDALAAAKWFRDHAAKYNVDTGRIVATGSSAGGHLSLMLGMTPGSANLGPPARVAAVVNFCGIADVADLLEGKNQRAWAAEWVPEQQDRHRLAVRVSPITYVRKDLPPILTLHGDADEVVPYNQSVKLTEALRASGATTEMVTVPEGGHRFADEKLIELYPQIFEFLKRHQIL